MAHQLIISKPRKTDHSYLSSLYFKDKHTLFTHTFERAKIIYVKPLSQRDEFFLFIRCKSSNDFMCDLNNHIIDTVQEKNASWFHTNMNQDLIEDYYTTTIVYDKKHGDLIRIKCVGDESVPQTFVEDTASLVALNVTFKHLRFYRQKIIVEAILESIKPETSFVCCDIADDDDEEEEPESPEPDLEDIDIIKQGSLSRFNEKLSKLTSQLTNIHQQISELEFKKEILINATDLSKITEICDSCQE